MALNEVTVLSNLPRFSGFPKFGETTQEGIDIRTFLRTLENYYTQFNITSDERKLQVLYSHINLDKGDALLAVSSYAGLPVTYDRVKQQLLQIYPAPNSTNFKQASKNFLHTELIENNMRCGVIHLTNTTRAVVEAYLSLN